MEVIDYSLLRNAIYPPTKLEDVENTHLMEAAWDKLRRKESWVEKYRPVSLKDVKHRDHVVRFLSSLEAHANMEGFLPELYKSRVSVINPEISPCVIKDVSDEISGFAPGQHKESYPCPPFNIIVLKEADLLSKHGQNALASLMDSKHTTRFILHCDPHYRLIPSLLSRCQIFTFNPLPKKFVDDYILQICEKEGLLIEGEALSFMFDFYKGSLRHAIQGVQAATRPFRNSILSSDILAALAPVPREAVLDLLYNCGFPAFTRVHKAIRCIYSLEYDVSSYLFEAFVAAFEYEGVADLHRAQICKHVIEADKRLCAGEDDYYVLVDLALDIMTVRLKNIITDDEVLRFGSVSRRRISNGQMVKGVFQGGEIVAGQKKLDICF